VVEGRRGSEAKCRRPQNRKLSQIFKSFLASFFYRKKKKLKTRLNCLKAFNPKSPSLQKLQHQVNLRAYDIQQNINAEMTDKEYSAVAAIKEYPKYFFSYAKKFSKLKYNIGSLRNNKTGLLQRDAR
jgi:hypothetical protein